MTDTIFFRLLDGVNRPSRLSGAIEELREGGEIADVYSAETTSLRQVPGSPFAYWASEEMRAKFADLQPFESEGRVARRTNGTTDDMRWIRGWWEVSPSGVGRARRWVPHAKGGAFSPYYSDVHLVIGWDEKEQTYPGYRGTVHRPDQRPASLSYFFRPGLTWPRRTNGLSFRVLPAQCIFGDKGPAVFVWDDDKDELLTLAAVTNSRPFLLFVQMLLARVSLAQSFEAGLIQSVPVPNLAVDNAKLLAGLASRCVSVKRRFDTVNETSHAFHLPALLQVESMTIEERIVRWQDQVLDSEGQLAEHQRKIDDIVFRLYEIEDEDRRAIEQLLSGENGAAGAGEDEGAAENEDGEEAIAVLDGGTLAADLLSYAVGCVFGRWDARIALAPSLTPQLADPFATLPVCSPGMLVGPDSLPAKRDGIASEEWMQARPDAITPPPDGSVENPTIPDSEYPLAVDWDGILVDDPDHPDDVVRRVVGVLELLWGKRADEIEGEACDLLGVKDLRTFFRNPRQFFERHVKCYSKSRRKAPIYWLLQSPKKNYGLWIYYHRLDPDLLFKALTNYAEPKIRLEEGRLEEYEARRRSAGTGGSEAKKAERAVDKQEGLLSDLREFRDRLARAANLNLEPDLNDGVVLNIAPLHELVPWKEAASKWKELLAGKYEWSSIGKQLRVKGIVS